MALVEKTNIFRRDLLLLLSKFPRTQSESTDMQAVVAILTSTGVRQSKPRILVSHIDMALLNTT